MTQYSLDLPEELRQDAKKWAASQGVNLNQFIQLAVAEKIGALNTRPGDPRFPQITYRRGASGVSTPILRGTGIRVQTVMTASQQWELEPDEIAEDYGISLEHVNEALAFYQAHSPEINRNIQIEEQIVAA